MGILALLIGLVPMVLASVFFMSVVKRRSEHGQDESGPLIGFAVLLTIFAFVELSIIINVLH